MTKPPFCPEKTPEPIGTLWCRLKPRHKGPCSYKGFFTARDGRRVCVNVAWGKMKVDSSEWKKA